MTLCPGKKINSAQSGPWDRDLDIDLQAIQVWGARALVNLMEEHEYELLRVPDYVAKVRSYPMEYYHLPIVDGHRPDGRFMELWKSAGPKLRQILLDGGKILIHCRAVWDEPVRWRLNCWWNWACRMKRQFRRYAMPVLTQSKHGIRKNMFTPAGR